MEGIIRRLLITLTIIGLVVGGVLWRNGYTQVEYYRGLNFEAFLKSQNIKCPDVSDLILHGGPWDKADACWKTQHDADVDQKVSFDNWTKADNEMDAGMMTVAGSIAIWPLFYLLKWILTGSVRRRKKPAAN